MTRSRWPLAVLFDGFWVLLFVGIGLRTHEQPRTFSLLVEVSAPFVIALAFGWLVLRLWRMPSGLVGGIKLWAITWTVAIGLRRVLGRGTALPFVLVAGLVLLATLVGWRAMWSLLSRWCRSVTGR